MQVDTEELKYQQIVLKNLGFYKGEIDGIWSGDSIAAKQAFEFDKRFNPAIPNNGLPFSTQERLPRGLIFKRFGVRTYLVVAAMAQADIDKLLGAKQVEKKEPVVPVLPNEGPVIAEAPKTEPKPEVK